MYRICILAFLLTGCVVNPPKSRNSVIDKTFNRPILLWSQYNEPVLNSAINYWNSITGLVLFVDANVGCYHNADVKITRSVVRPPLLGYVEPRRNVILLSITLPLEYELMTLIHEMGHVLGLTHSSPHSLMNSSLPPSLSLGILDSEAELVRELYQ